MRNVFRIEQPYSIEDGATIVKVKKGVSISVSEEKAIDSYNATIDCNVVATDAQAIGLRDWLLKYYPLTPAPIHP